MGHGRYSPSPSVSSSYNVSRCVSVDRDEDYTSVDPSLSSARDAVDADTSEEQRLPKRLFSTDRYPTEGRVNCYSKPQYLVDILSVLDGTEELKTLKQSPFSSLFDLPVRRCSLSGKLIHNILSRQLVTKNPDELWFTFGGYPIRFSLEEFQKITGLPCGPYPDEDLITAAQTPSEPASHFWYTLVGPETDISIEDIVIKLKNDSGMPGWRKLRLSLIVIVEGVLSCGTQPIRPSFPIVEMVRNLNFFFAYPWGRHSFEMTLRMVRVGNVIRRQSVILKKLKQPSLVVHGFPIALQLMLFESVPLLVRYLPYKDDLQTFYDRGLGVLTSLKTYHTDNILHLENDKQLSVSHTVSLLPTDVDDVLGGISASDPHVAYMLRLIEEGFKFQKADWLGGDDSLDKLCICKKKQHRRCKCGSSGAGDHYSDQAGGTSTFTCSNNEEIAKLRKEVHDLQKKTASMITNMRLELLSEMKILLSSHRSVRCVFNGTPGDVGTQKCGTDVPPHGGLNRDFENEWNSPGNDGFVAKNQDSIPDPPSHLGDDDCVHIPNPDISGTENNVIPGGEVPCGQSVPSAHSVPSHGRLSKEVPVGSTGVPVSSFMSPLDKPYSQASVVAGTAVPSTFSLPQVNAKLRRKTSRTIPNAHSCQSADRGVPSRRSTSPVCKVSEVDDVCRMISVDDSNELRPPSPIPVSDLPPHITPFSFTLPVKRLRKRSSVPLPTPNKFNGKKRCTRPAIADDDYNPFPRLDVTLVNKFKKKVQGYRQKTYDMDGVIISKSFFKDIYTPQKWLFRTHLDLMIRPLWRRRGPHLAEKGIVVLDSLLTQLLCCHFRTFGDPSPSPTYAWHPLLASYIEGSVGDRSESTVWFRDVDTVYAPMNWGNKHWVALVICLTSCHIDILDPLVSCTSDEEVASFMQPLVYMLPLLIKATCEPSHITHLDFLNFTYHRVQGLPQNTRGGDCGAFVVKFIEMHSQKYGLNGNEEFTDEMVDRIRMQYAIDVYEEFVGKVLV